MVDCGNTRCALEKKSFKKELLTWSKKIPIAVGLEAIAEGLGDKESIKELFAPFSSKLKHADTLYLINLVYGSAGISKTKSILHDCLENEEVDDWLPEKNCFFCESRVQLVFEAIEQLIEEAKNGKGVQDNPSMRYLQEILPYCPQFYTQNVGRELLAELKSTTQQNQETQEVEVSVPQPPKGPVELKIPHITTQASKHKKENIPNCKRNYTDEELNAAVSEIQNGKLGTRRASMLYGIPRSTLRNKIFRMGSDKQGISLANHLDDNIDDSSDTENSMKWPELIPSNSLLLSLPQLPLSFLCETSDTGSKEVEEIEKKLDTIRKKHNLQGKKENYHKEYVHELKIPVLKDIIRKLAEERFEMERNASRVRSMKLDEEKPVKGINGLKQPSIGRGNEHNEKNSSPTPFHNIIIPSYKAARCQVKPEPIAMEHTFTSSLDKFENSRIGETLKDIIMKTITEKVRCKSQSDLFPVSSQISLDQKKSGSSDSLSAPSPLKQIKREESDRKRGSTSDPAGSPAKKTRPKRGQYRKYNSQLLMEAVKAVQRGEMSVHRAGSYYGVPHSTLEYKVKERHLLRQKKIKEQQQQQKEAGIINSPSSKRTSTAASSSISTNEGTGRGSGGSKTIHSSKGESSKKSEKTNKTDQNCPAWFSPYLPGGTHFDAAAGLGFYNASGFALNTPASELLRKLQHKVQSKSDSFTEEPGYKVLGSNSVGSLGEGFLFIN